MPGDEVFVLSSAPKGWRAASYPANTADDTIARWEQNSISDPRFLFWRRSPIVVCERGGSLLFWKDSALMIRVVLEFTLLVYPCRPPWESIRHELGDHIRSAATATYKISFRFLQAPLPFLGMDHAISLHALYLIVVVSREVFEIFNLFSSIPL